MQARSRRLLTYNPGDIVYYFRYGRRGNRKGEYRGPARVLASEPPDNNSQSSVVWLTHAGTLIRAAPEHLRKATPIETNVEQVINGEASRNSNGIRQIFVVIKGLEVTTLN